MQELRPLGPVLCRAGHLSRERLDARLTEYEVTPVQIHVLHYLYHRDNQAPQRDITAHLKVKPSTANGILDRMVEKGLVERTVSETDARKRLITLTEKGREQQAACRRIFMETEQLMVQGLSPEEQDTLFALLHRVITNLEEDR